MQVKLNCVSPRKIPLDPKPSIDYKLRGIFCGILENFPFCQMHENSE